MTEKELLYFKMIADKGSFSKASKELFIAQPTLTQYIQRIENRIGTTLFIRSERGVVLTDSGKAYYRMVQKILKSRSDFLIEIDNKLNLRKGTITFGIVNQLGTLLLPQIIPGFHSLYPQIEFYVVEDYSGSLMERLRNYEVDFLITHAFSTIDHRGVKLDFLKKNDFLVAINKNNPIVKKAEETSDCKYPVIDLNLLKEELLITVPKGQRIREQVDSLFDKAGFKPVIGLTLRSIVTAVHIVSENYGYTIIPEDYLGFTENLSQLAFLSVDPKYEARWYTCIATNEDSFLSSADTEMIKYIKNIIV